MNVTYFQASNSLNSLYTHINEQQKTIDEQKKTIEELKERITCLESDSHNEVSQAEFDDLKEQSEHYQDSIEEALNMCGFSEGDAIVDAVKSLKEKLDIVEADEEQEATLSARLLEENKKLKNMIAATWPGLLP